MRTERLDVLRGVALAAVVVGAFGSLGLTLHVGGYRVSILMLLFVIWVLSPFVVLFVAALLPRSGFQD